jgi:hypothetical protein
MPSTGSAESSGLIEQISLAETGSGLSHGPMAIVLAVGAALVVYPIGRLIRGIRRGG